MFVTALHRRQSHVPASDWIHLWKFTTDNSTIDTDDYGNAASPVSLVVAGTPAVGTKAGAYCVYSQAATDYEYVNYDDLALDLRSGGDDYSLVVGYNIHADYGECVTSAPTQSAALFSYMRSSVGGIFNYIDNGATLRAISSASPGTGARAIIAFSRFSSTETVFIVSSQGSFSATAYASSSPATGQEKLIFGRTIKNRSGHHWAGIKDSAVTISELEAMLSDWGSNLPDWKPT